MATPHTESRKLDFSVLDAHIIADLERELGKARREIASARRLLIDARSALEEGRLHIVDEFTDRALGHLASAVTS